MVVVVSRDRAYSLWLDGAGDGVISDRLGVTRHRARVWIRGFEAARGDRDGVRRWVVLSDVHVPFEDAWLLGGVLGWMGTQVLDGVILNGDILDCEKISRFFSLNPVAFEDEVVRCASWVDRVEVAARRRNDDVELHWHDGNHEARVERWLADRGPEIAGLTDKHGDAKISVPSLLGLRDRGWRYRTYHQTFELVPGLFVEHGDKVSKHSAYTAKNIQFDKGASVVVGHTHRQGLFCKSDRNGVHRALEGGCLCIVNPSYITEKSANWQQGFVVIDLFPDGSWMPQLVSVFGEGEDRGFFVDGMRWRLSGLVE